MTALGVFRDEYYNAINVLPLLYVPYPTGDTRTSGTIPAAALAGGQITSYNATSATALTTDTAANIIARLQQAVAVQYKALGIFPGAGSGGPAVGVPNTNNLSYLLWIVNNDGGTLTITAGSGVTFVNAASSTTTTIPTITSTAYQVTVTGPNSVSITQLNWTANAT